MRSSTRAVRSRSRYRLRSVLACAAAAALLTACSGAASKGPSGGDGPAAAPGKDDKLTLTVYSNFSDREYNVVTAALNKFKSRYPNIEIKHEGNQDDDKILGAIRANNSPDVAISFFTDNLGQFCTNGVFQDLGPYVKRDNVDLNVIPQAVRDYTAYKDNRCALPLLTDVYALYYNKDMFATAGITTPPKTNSELLEYARKLTQYNPDGSIKVAGYLPLVPFYRNQVQNFTPSFGAKFLKADGKSGLAGSPEWKELFEFHKKLVDAYGYDKIETFRAGLGQEFSPDHAFQQGKIAMMIDGEYRTAFIADQAPNVEFDTAPMAVADNKPELYGTGFATGTIVGVPKGAKNAGAAWELIKFLALDTDVLVELSNGLKNIPTTQSSLNDPRLEVSEQFKTFLDIYKSNKLVSNPVTAIGDAHLKAVNDFTESWQSGKVSNLEEGLKKVDQQIDDAIAQKSGK